MTTATYTPGMTGAGADPRPFFHTAGSVTHAILRMGAALLFMQHGVQKIFGLLGGIDQAGGTVPLMSQMGLAGVLELVGGFMLLIGILTRPVAVILVLEMIAAYVMAHMPNGLFPVQNQGELALIYALVFAYFAGNGAGRWSVDNALRSNRSAHIAEPVTVNRTEAPRTEIRHHNAA
jgi:putative oxidoreductase